MKYLLKQKIKRIFTSFNEVHVYPGIPGLIKLANNLNIEYKKVQKQDGEYLITDYYIFTKNDYYWILLYYKLQITYVLNVIMINISPENWIKGYY